MGNNASKVELSKVEYIFRLSSYIKDIYEQDGVSILRYYEEEIKRDFKNVYSAIRSMFDYKKRQIYKSTLKFKSENKYVYDAVQILIPQNNILYFNIRTETVEEGYDFLKIYSFKKCVKIHRIDLITAILIFTEEFILDNISSEGVTLKQDKLTIEKESLLFSICKIKGKVLVHIKIKDIITLVYEILQ